MVRLLTVDSGTTNTRVRLVEGGHVLKSEQAQAGARDGASAIRAALTGLLDGFRGHGAEAVLFSGMITSPTGLVEIPHVPGPLSLDRLILVRHDFSELSPLPFYFIPGVRLGKAGDGPEHGDIIRGEETELAGYMALHGASGSRLFLHLGSHHKAMCVQDGRLTDSVTALTGELMQAAAHHTLLASSVVLSDGYDTDWALRAADMARREGPVRALFALRLMDVREKLPMTARMGWLLGAFAQADLDMLAPRMEALPDELVLYGREGFAQVLSLLVARRWPACHVRVLTPQESDALAPAGAWLTYQNQKEKAHDR